MFGTIQGKLKTPAVGTLILAFICLFGIVLASSVTSISTVFDNLIPDIGVLIAFYYGVTGLACAWAYRKVAFKRPQVLLHRDPVPVPRGHRPDLRQVRGHQGSPAGAVPTPVIITMALGIPLVILARFTTKGEFFKTKVVAYEEIGE